MEILPDEGCMKGQQKAEESDSDVEITGTLRSSPIYVSNDSEYNPKVFKSSPSHKPACFDFNPYSSQCLQSPAYNYSQSSPESPGEQTLPDTSMPETSQRGKRRRRRARFTTRRRKPAVPVAKPQQQIKIDHDCKFLC